MLPNLLAFAQIPSDTSLRIEITNCSKNGISGIVSNTEANIQYELQYKEGRTNWLSLGFIFGSETANQTAFHSGMTNLVERNIRVRSWKDSYDMGIPDWWQMRYFGTIGIDAYANPTGDGWNNLLKYQQGMDPFKCYPPAGPHPELLPAFSVHFTGRAFFTELGEVTAESISNAILSVSAKQQADGYELTVKHPIAHARYLLLVRDKNDRQWRASGYFVSGTNRNPVYLYVDKKGMMTDLQSPIALPVLKFLPDVVQPEFTAGWGEDSDGDGLPDIYEVLVTHTKPDDPDTGDTGVPDGYKVFANDGWNNWEKFRYRANPFKKYEPPPAIVLKEPTMAEMMEAQEPKTDLPYDPELEIRTNGSAYFQPYSLWLDSHYLAPAQSRNGHACCDVRISWKVPPPNP